MKLFLISALVGGFVLAMQMPATQSSQQVNPPFSEQGKAPFSLSITAPETVKAGAAISVRVVLTNTSDKRIGVSRIRGQDREMALFDVTVTDENGKPITSERYQILRKYLCLADPQTVANGVHPCPGSSSTIALLEPGETWSDELGITKLFDLSQPGRYTIQVSRAEWNGRVLVGRATSNPATVAVIP